MNTYITIDETSHLYPHVSEFSSEQQDSALQTSFSLVNSFLDSTLNVPVVLKDGKIPGILKIAQARFVQWILESANNGWTVEMQNLFDSNADMLRKIGRNELFISEAQITEAEIGWNLASASLSLGKVFLNGNPPDVETEYRFEVITPGYASQVQFNVYRSDSPEVFGTLTGSFNWTALMQDEKLTLRFDGQFLEGESFIVRGIPFTRKTVSNKPVIKQSTIEY